MAENDWNFDGGDGGRDGRRHGMLVFNDWRIARFPQSLSSSRPYPTRNCWTIVPEELVVAWIVVDGPSFPAASVLS